jgi:Uma2 family endonuclease
MALLAPKTLPLPESHRFPQEIAPGSQGAVFRPLRKPNGELVIEELPLTLEVLLDPREEDQMTQSRGHGKELGSLADALNRFLERKDDVVVLSDVLILWKALGERNVAPDVAVVKGVRDREAIDESFDPVTQGAGPCLIFEVVSESTADVLAKDEKKNPPLFAKMGVEDLVLVYPRRPGKRPRLELDVKHLDASGRYRANRPGPGGWILLASVGLRIKVADDGRRLLVEDVQTGERLLTSVEEESARRAAEARVEQAEERVEQALRRFIEDLCAVLGLAWGAERSRQVEDMSAPQLEALRAHLVREKSWPRTR